MKVQATYDMEKKILSVTYRNETRDFPCYELGTHALASNVFSAKFRSGEKLWPCGVTYSLQTNTACVQAGGHSNKGGANIIVGWWNKDSQHNTQAVCRM